jgi:hypothetical protein
MLIVLEYVELPQAAAPQQQAKIKNSFTSRCQQDPTKISFATAKASM